MYNRSPKLGRHYFYLYPPNCPCQETCISKIAAYTGWKWVCWLKVRHMKLLTAIARRKNYYEFGANLCKSYWHGPHLQPAICKTAQCLSLEDSPACALVWKMVASCQYPLVQIFNRDHWNGSVVLPPAVIVTQKNCLQHLEFEPILVPRSLPA